MQVGISRLIRDIRRKIQDDEGLQEAFAIALSRADQVCRQRQRQRGWKLYSLHAPEVERIGKGNPSNESLSTGSGIRWFEVLLRAVIAALRRAGFTPQTA